jgi:SAM-dependent methyltransferase
MDGYLKRLKDRHMDLHYPVEELARWCREHLARAAGPTYRILDVGLGSGRDLKAIRGACLEYAPELYGIENREDWVREHASGGIATCRLDIEREALPFPDGFFDIVLSNQVIEHTKELFWIFAEIARVLKSGGMAIIGCPNLGSWHNRVALLVGMQPPCMKVLSSHIRGITKSGLRELVESGAYFEMVGYHGANFYPFGGGLNRALARLFPTLAATHYFILRRTSKAGSFLEVLDRNASALMDTPYFRGSAATPLAR